MAWRDRVVPAIAAVLCSLPAAFAAPGDPGPAYPAAAWDRCEPEEAGLDAGRLDAFRDLVGGRGCVVRYGRMVYSWGDISQRADVASAAKPWYSYFLLRALEDGRIGSVDDAIEPLVPGLAALNPGLGHKDRGITWRHLASQTSCYGVTEAPGTAFDYNDWQMALFFDTLFLRVYGATWDTIDASVLRPLLTDRLQCEDSPTFMAFGTDDRPGRLGVSVRDFARFGLLFLREGRWGDRQLLTPEHARMLVSSPLPGDFARTSGQEAAMLPEQRTMGSRSVPDDQCDHLGSYSWLWWTNGVDREGGRHWPDAPPDAYGAFGHGGPRAMVVIPSLDLVVSWNDARIEGREAENEALRLLVAAVGGPRPGQIVADPSSFGGLRWNGGGPAFLCGPGDPEGFLYRGELRPDGTRAGDQLELIRQLEGTGANTIYMIAVRSHGGDGDDTENPFIGHDPARGVNSRVLDQWDEWLSAMDRAGVVSFVFIYDDSTQVWPTGDSVEEPERAFIEALVGRLKHHTHLVWCIAEEYAEALSAARVRNLAAVIREADDCHHPIAVHKNHGLSFAEFAEDPNIDVFAVQYNVSTADELHRGLLEARREAAGRYGVLLSEAADWGTGAEARGKAWACAMAGAPAMVLGMDVASTSRDDLEGCGHLARFFGGLGIGLEPHDRLAAGRTEYVLARPGEAYVAYSSDAAGELGLRDVEPGPYALRWLDCATGRAATGTVAHAAPGPLALRVPAGLGPEVALELRRLAR